MFVDVDEVVCDLVMIVIPVKKVNFNHSGIAVLLPNNIWDGNTVDPYIKLHSEPTGFDSWLDSSPLKLLHSGQCYQSRCCPVAKLRCQSG